jgi:hypothetical protein
MAREGSGGNVAGRLLAGSAAEIRRFSELQARLPELFRRVFSDPLAARTVVVVPGLSLDAEQLARIPGTLHYEERHLSMLFLLRLPNTRLVYVTSEPLPAAVVDYYLGMLGDVPAQRARDRLVLLSACDGSLGSVTRKILDRPRLLTRLRATIGDPHVAHLSVFNSSPLERTLAVRLGIPLYACDPALAGLGGKSGARRLFREAGIPFPDGSEGLRDARDVTAALTALKRRQPGLRRAVVKLDDGFSGEGNAIFEFEGAPEGNSRSLARWVESRLPCALRYEARDEAWDNFCRKLAAEQGVVEAWVEGDEKHSPSVQFRITPLGGIECISTHDQVLGGPSGQVFQGSTFPARDAYRALISGYGARVAERLRERGVIGRFAVDFVVARSAGGWRASAIEINLRKGGTTFPLQLLQLLTDGRYDPEEGLFRTREGEPRYYYATDNLRRDAFRRLTPRDVIEVAVERRLQYDRGEQQGIAFGMLGSVSGYGKLGITAIGDSPGRCLRLYQRTVGQLDAAAR